MFIIKFVRKNQYYISDTLSCPIFMVGENEDRIIQSYRSTRERYTYHVTGIWIIFAAWLFSILKNLFAGNLIGLVGLFAFLTMILFFLKKLIFKIFCKEKIRLAMPKIKIWRTKPEFNTYSFLLFIFGIFIILGSFSLFVSPSPKKIVLSLTMFLVGTLAWIDCVFSLFAPVYPENN